MTSASDTCSTMPFTTSPSAKFLKDTSYMSRRRSYSSGSMGASRAGSAGEGAVSTAAALGAAVFSVFSVSGMSGAKPPGLGLLFRGDGRPVGRLRASRRKTAKSKPPRGFLSRRRGGGEQPFQGCDQALGGRGVGHRSHVEGSRAGRRFGRGADDHGRNSGPPRPRGDHESFDRRGGGESHDIESLVEAMGYGLGQTGRPQRPVGLDHVHRGPEPAQSAGKLVPGAAGRGQQHASPGAPGAREGPQ